MKFKKTLACILAASSLLSFSACSDSSNNSDNTTTTADNSDNSVTENGGNENNTDNSSNGEKLTLKVLTCRTDRKEDGSLDAMTDAFEEKYNCTVEYQAFTDYVGDVSTMMNTSDYGDVLMIPSTVKTAELGNFFEPLGTYEDLKTQYKWADSAMYDGTVYGLAYFGNIAGGICYNKRIWSEAGITTLPKTADEFIADLKIIKEKFPDVIPYYTNYAAASWTLSQWGSLVVSASGNPSYETDKLVNKEDLFVKGDAYYDVFKLMYDVFSEPDLIEADPISTDWEGSKLMIAKGEIATMVMGSWAVAQFKQIASENGLNPDDIGYMPAPFSKDGVQYAQSAPDYSLGVNKNSDEAVKELGKKYITWFISESGNSEKEGAINTLIDSELPDFLTDFEDCTFFTAETAPDGLVGVWNTIDNDSEVGIGAGDAANFKLQMAEAAFAGEGDAKYDEIVSTANEKWNATRDANEQLTAYLSSNG